MQRKTISKTAFILGLAARKLALHPRESVLKVRMAAWVVLIPVLVRLTSLTRAQRLMSPRLRSTSADDCSVPAKLARAVDSLLGIDLFVFRRSCWKRAMILQRFLALNGIDSQINFGLRREPDGEVSGHAWLERQGRPLLETDPVNYVVTFSLPPRPNARAL